MRGETFRYAIKNLVNRKLRSFLTILSITIGIMAIFTLVSFGLGLSNYIEEVSKEMGTDKLIIQPRGGGGLASIPENTLSQADVEFIDKINGIEKSTGVIIKTAIVKDELNSAPKFVYLMGSDTDTESRKLWSELMTVEIESGRDLKKGDGLKAVLGHRFTQPESIFIKPVQLGQKIYVNDIKVEVIGFYESLDNPQDDSNIYLTYDGVEALLDVSEEYEWIMARTAPTEDPKVMSEKVSEKLRREKGQEKGKETFFVQTFDELIESFSQIIGVLNAVLVMIALVSVVIAGINIMNTMYTSVLERTKQIGIMKSVGARNSDILKIFLVEAGVLGLIGGGIGIILGYSAARLGGNIAANAGYGILQPIFPMWLVLTCLLFAFVVGALAGISPAINASRQNPVNALRYE